MFRPGQKSIGIIFIGTLKSKNPSGGSVKTLTDTERGAGSGSRVLNYSSMNIPVCRDNLQVLLHATLTNIKNNIVRP